MPQLLTLDFSDDWHALEYGWTLDQLERQVLPIYLSHQRWFASKGAKIDRAELINRSILSGLFDDWLLAIFRVHLAGDRSEDYFVPLAAVWDPQSPTQPPTDSNQVLANICAGERTGILRDALAEPRFAADLARAAGNNMTLTGSQGALRFSHTHAYFPLQDDEERNIRKLGAEQSNTSILIASKMVLKAYRKLARGIQPELEMGRYLTDVAGYRNTPPLLGTIEQFDASGQPAALAVIQGFVPNLADGWSFTLNHLRGLFDGILQGKSEHWDKDSFMALMERLGTRIGELHQALAMGTSDPAFEPEPISVADLELQKNEIQTEAKITFGILANSEAFLLPEQQTRVRALLGKQNHILSLISSFIVEPGSALAKTRFHGDLHLGQVLVAGDDFYIVDFEGEPARSFAQRRAKQSPIKDVAGMLRSLNYAAWSVLLESEAEEAGRLAQLQKPALEWVQASSDAMLQGYMKAAKGCLSFPAKPTTFHRLLDLFILEKALYEVRYELANRPSWLQIPVEGILSLLGHG
ncbi:MAG: hypothetical protein EPN47_07350 [Acidobacteria bacterium]|nr:MAG: hypothetical protein EPN47_07350 [Acidobacteriota bacterium]